MDKVKYSNDKKKSSRKDLKIIRSKIGLERRKSAQDSFLYQIKNLSIIRDSSKIGVYYSFGSELATTKVIEYLWLIDKLVFLPVCYDESEIFFSGYFASTKLEQNAFNIYEPMVSNRKGVDVCDLDCILVPCLGIDNDGYRIGFGKGMYDKTLAKVIRRKVFVIYVSYKECLLDTCWPQGHDYKSDHNIIV